MNEEKNDIDLELADLGDASVETKQPSAFHDIKDSHFTWTWWE